MKKTFATIFITLITCHALAGEKYTSVIYKYAEAAFSELVYLEPNQYNNANTFITALKNHSATIIYVTDKIKRKVIVVLHPSGDGSLYVSMIVNEDGFIEIHGRGGINVSPEIFEKNKEKYIDNVIFYPDSV